MEGRSWYPPRILAPVWLFGEVGEFCGGGGGAFYGGEGGKFVVQFVSFLSLSSMLLLPAIVSLLLLLGNRVKLTKKLLSSA